MCHSAELLTSIVGTDGITSDLNVVLMLQPHQDEHSLTHKVMHQVEHLVILA